MSTFADPDKGYVWLDGDAFRAPKGTGEPNDPFAASVETGTGTPVIWDAYGGLEVGFNIDPKRDVKTLPVWNHRQSPYATVKGPLEEKVKFRAVDFSKATVLTALQGGSIVAIGATTNFRWVPGDDEEFALTLRVVDDTGKQAWYSERVTLTTPAPRTFGGDKLDGFEFELLALSPLVPITNWNPLAP